MGEVGSAAVFPAPRYLDEALELCVLLQQPGLLLLQREDVLCRLLEDGCLGAAQEAGQCT